MKDHPGASLSQSARSIQIELEKSGRHTGALRLRTAKAFLAWGERQGTLRSAKPQLAIAAPCSRRAQSFLPMAGQGLWTAGSGHLWPQRLRALADDSCSRALSSSPGWEWPLEHGPSNCRLRTGKKETSMFPRRMKHVPRATGGADLGHAAADRSLGRNKDGPHLPMHVAQAADGATPKGIRALNIATSLYPVYVALGGALGAYHPSAYNWFLAGAPSSLSLALGIIMASMGLTLRVEDLVSVLRNRPKAVIFGCACQYVLMPLSGLVVARLFSLPADMAAGLVLLCCCPGGTASNVVTFIANGDVPLSVIMTLISTLLAAIATPLLTQLLIGSLVPVDILGLAQSTLQVVLLPVLLGAGLNSLWPQASAAVAPYCPLVAVVVSSVLASSVFSSSLATFLRASSGVAAGPSSLMSVAVAVTLAHFFGFAFGYLASQGGGYSESQRRAVSIEVGMQNSSLGVVLALQHLPSPASALPAALSAIIMNVMGSTLGAAWRLRDSAKNASAEETSV